MSILDVQKESENRYSAGGRYKHSFIQQVVREVEEGLDIKEAYKQYGLRGKTLRDWLDKFASPSYGRPKLKCYPVVQRRSICRAIAEGKLTPQQAANTYHVHVSTVYSWQKQEKNELYSNDVALKKSKKKSAATESAEQEDDQVKNLQQQLADANLKIAALNTLIDVAEEQLKINIRKKPGAKQS